MPQLKSIVLTLGLMIVSMLAIILFQQASLPKLAWIDMPTLIHQQAAKLAAHNSGTHEVQLIADRIKAQVTHYAKQHNLILITKGAICGSQSIDHTAKVIEFMDSNVK